MLSLTIIGARATCRKFSNNQRFVQIVKISVINHRRFEKILLNFIYVNSVPFFVKMYLVWDIFSRLIEKMGLKTIIYFYERFSEKFSCVAPKTTPKTCALTSIVRMNLIKIQNSVFQPTSFFNTFVTIVILTI